MARHVESAQNRNSIIFLQYIKKKVLQSLLCSVVMRNIQIFNGGPVMFVVVVLKLLISSSYGMIILIVLSSYLRPTGIVPRPTESSWARFEHLIRALSKQFC